MMHDAICYIVGAGDDFGLPFEKRQEDFLIAADAGFRAIEAAGMTPDLVIGDFDSLGAAPAHRNIVTLPVIKDITDTWAAIEQGTQRGYTRFDFYGCSGGRMEHTIANLQTLSDLAARDLDGRLYTEKQVVIACRNSTVVFPAECSGFLSVFSMTDQCRDVTLTGLKYTLDHHTLDNRFPLGVSNEFIGEESTVTIGCGTALLVFDRCNSFERK